MSDFGDYFLHELLELKLTERDWLVENLIREKDSVILVGDEKSGKSLLIFQLISALTSGQHFLDTHKTNKERKVVYIQLEGELNDSQDRFRRLRKTLEYKAENCLVMFRPPLEMQEKSFSDGLTTYIKKKLDGHNPDIVIFDPLYFSFSGSLSDDAVVRKFIGNIRVLKEALNCAVVLVHHTHKIRWTNDGFQIDEGDDALFGSKFFKAWADHILLFMYNKKQEVRMLSCNTQRSGDIVKSSTLKLIEPDPLYFEITQEHVQPLKDLAIVDLLKAHPEGMTKADICKTLTISEPLFYKSIKPALTQKQIVKTENIRPVVFKFNKETE